MNRRSLIAVSFAASIAGLAGLAASPASAQDSEIERINSYLNSISTLAGNFVQVAPDGIVSEGQFFMRRPGRLRFEYKRPNPTLVIADGFWVAVLDKTVGTGDRFPLSQTPLNLLLKDDVDLNAEGAIRNVEQTEGQLRVTAVDPSDESQGDVTMVFDSNPLQLKQWIVTDPQGLTTTVALRETRANVKLEAELFVIPNNLDASDN
ncbi:MAG: outer membrane lipoprotein carrier protein LolA [Rhodobacteraceae bacterium]|nr:outer membrane lipoprotein carrier protein LolA [Paracoccaceae bacterium]